MRGKKIDLTDTKIGALRFIAPTEPINGRRAGMFLCDCGRTVNKTVSYVVERGQHASCGCQNKRQLTKHGKRNSITYVSWVRMKERCDNPNVNCYRDYGGRGISYCDEWKTFPNFLRDMGERPSQEYTLDRINNELGYSPENCRWATAQEQIENRRCAVKLTYQGQTLSLRGWATKTGLPLTCLAARHFKGWSDARIIETPWTPRHLRKHPNPQYKRRKAS